MTIKSEPVMAGAIVNIIVALTAVFGFELTAQQTAGLMSLTIFILGWIARSRVTPV